MDKYSRALVGGSRVVYVIYDKIGKVFYSHNGNIPFYPKWEDEACFADLFDDLWDAEFVIKYLNVYWEISSCFIAVPFRMTFVEEQK